MRSRLSQLVATAFLLLGIAYPTSNEAIACATLSDENAPKPENFVTSERAVIIWDEAHKIEHFIRQASILTQGSDLGFLVPTPQTPNLAEADERIFNMAAFLGQPAKIAPTNYHSPWTLISPFVMSSLLHLDRLNPSTLFSRIQELKVTPEKPAVLAQQDVAGYHATILAAEDEQSLSAWLAANGYLSTPELRGWLRPYIVAKWKITAFRLIKTDDAPLLTTRAIRLSFHTDRPFYPYSEPSDRQQANAASPQGRALRVSILSNERMAGALANNNPWPEKLEFAGPSAPTDSAKTSTVNQWLAFARLNGTGYDTMLPSKLTTFIDESNPRPGTADLYFSPDADQSDFQGSAVDFTLPPQDRLIFNHPFVDIGSLFMLVVLPAVPIYCGWKVLNQEIIPFKSRWEFQSSGPAQTVTSRNTWTRIIDGLAGVIAIVLGGYYGTQLFLLLAGEIVSAFLGWSSTGGVWIWLFLGLLLAVIVLIAMSWGIVFCGVKVLRSSTAAVPLSLTKISFDEGLRNGFLAALSFFAGCAALIVVESVVVSML